MTPNSIQSDPADEAVELRVGAHVLVQLGSELVTDVEQAILECVKNAYDADAPGCLIDVSTTDTGELVEEAPAAKLSRFRQSCEGVDVTLQDSKGRPLLDMVDPDPDEQIRRTLRYTGRITIEDHGDGLTPGQLKSSWLVVSRSNKRAATGAQKATTKKGRTPLGDKGLGRLGSMKLGDILRIETAVSPDAPIASAQFRWTDLESADTVDQIPVFINEQANETKFKGTRVSVLGLKDLEDWRRQSRRDEITKSLAQLISPFEATSTFPVGIKIDGPSHSLASVTNDALSRAVAKFEFKWADDPERPGEKRLEATAFLRKKLLASERNTKTKDRSKIVFGEDGGAAFGDFLKNYKRLKGYPRREIAPDGPWFVTVGRTFAWKDLVPDGKIAGEDPGAFDGAFYFFHLDELDPVTGDVIDALDTTAASGVAIDKSFIKSMSGISILRDGFRVRSQGDWLDIAGGMTSGTTYGMRVENTIGYFQLTGRENYRLTEKSDREGFVENAAYRGFSWVAIQCRNFANNALMSVRRGLDDYYAQLVKSQAAPEDQTTEGSMDELDRTARATEEAKVEAERIAGELTAKLAALNQPGADQVAPSEAIEIANQAARAIEALGEKLKQAPQAAANVQRLRQAFDDKREQAISLFESAAVGLSARGLAHELRTHLSEIRHRTAALEREANMVGGATILPHLRAIRSSCAAISNAAALIDPMLPRSRAIKETIVLKTMLEEYRDARAAALDRLNVQLAITGEGPTVRINRPRLVQVVDNLVRNSLYWLRRAQGTGGLGRAQQIDIELTPTGLVLSDTGPGVDPHVEDALFDIFVTAKPDPHAGQGLGLFIISELLAIDGGSVQLLHDRNSEGRRYRFAVDLSGAVQS